MKYDCDNKLDVYSLEMVSQEGHVRTRIAVGQKERIHTGTVRACCAALDCLPCYGARRVNEVTIWWKQGIRSSSES